LVRIDTYNQYFTVASTNASKLIHMLYDFNKGLITYKMSLTRQKGSSRPKVITIPDKYYYLIETSDVGHEVRKDRIRYPITLIDSLVTFLEERGVDSETIEIEHHGPLKGRDVTINLNPNYIPRDYQEIYIDKITKIPKHNVLLDLYTGYGKAVRRSTPIKTPHGWTPIGELKVGDRVIGRFGQETNVTGVYPQGKLQLYKVKFVDGRTLDVCKEHLWTINSGSAGRVTVSTETMSEYLLSQDHMVNNISIDLIEPMDSVDKEFYMSPLMYGMEIGDIHNADYPSRSFLDGSKEQRTDLLLGLLSGNNSIVRKGYLIFRTHSKQKSDYVVELVRGLGGLCSSVKIKNEYVLSMILRDTSKFKDNWCNLKDTVGLKLRVVSIEKIDIDEAVCISVDAPDKLFVAKDYIVTHNTFISMASMAKFNKAFSIFILPRYIDKWIGDITTLTDIKEDEILVIKGLTNLTNILNNPELAKPYKCFILSLTTLNYLMKKYMSGELIEYTSKSPEDLFKVLNTDIVLNDETHQEFSNVYKIMLFSNIKLFIGITATLMTKDPNVEKMHTIMFPNDNRASNIVKYDPYIHITSVRFRFMYKKQIRFKNNFGYNQAMFEGSIIKNSTILYRYLKMIYGLLNGFYFNKRVEGDKAIIFMGTVNMCSLMVDYIKSKSRNLKITKYTEEDDYSVIEASDIIISTPSSASTALDIPNLVTTIQTFNVDSVTANLQTLGRLRDLKGKKMDFIYTWSSDIKQHKTYNANRLKLFIKRAKHIKSIEYRELV